MSHHKAFVLSTAADTLNRLARELIEASRDPNKAQAACLNAARELRQEASFLLKQIDPEPAAAQPRSKRAC